MEMILLPILAIIALAYDPAPAQSAKNKAPNRCPCLEECTCQGICPCPKCQSAYGREPVKEWQIPQGTDPLTKLVFEVALDQMKKFGIERSSIWVEGEGTGLEISAPPIHIRAIKTALKNGIPAGRNQVYMTENVGDGTGSWRAWIGPVNEKPWTSNDAFGWMGPRGPRGPRGFHRRGPPRHHHGWRPPVRHHHHGPGPWYAWWPYGTALYSTPVIVNDEPLPSTGAAGTFATWAQGQTEQPVDVDDDGTVRVSFDGKGAYASWRRRMASEAAAVASKFGAVPQIRSTVMGFAVQFLAR